MSMDNSDSPWDAEHWTCQGCSEPLSEIVDGPGATLCFPCRNPAAGSVDVFPLVCEECGKPAQVRIMTAKGMLCMSPCGERFLENQSVKAVAKAGRENKAWWERLLRKRQAQKEAV